MSGTFQRVMVHSERMDAKEYLSSSHEAFGDPGVKETNLQYRPNCHVGKRQALVEERLKQIAAQQLDSPPPQRNFETTMRDSFRERAPDPRNSPGKRRIKNQDFKPSTGRDVTFLVESGILKPHFAVTPNAEGEVPSDTAITLYSEKPDKFPMSLRTATNPLKKNR